MIEVKRRTVYVARGKTYLTLLRAYRREAMLSVLARAGELFERDFGEVKR